MAEALTEARHITEAALDRLSVRDSNVLRAHVMAERAISDGLAVRKESALARRLRALERVVEAARGLSEASLSEEWDALDTALTALESEAAGGR